MKKLTAFVVAACVVVAPGLAAAAGEGAHGHHGGAMKNEQKDWGMAGNAKAVSRTVTLTMTDSMRFTPDRIDVKQGETLRFVVKNAGQLPHEMVIGTQKELDAHAAQMMASPGMAHDEPGKADVAPGKSGEIVWTFNRPGSFDFACLIAGHYQAGMRGKLIVAAR